MESKWEADLRSIQSKLGLAEQEKILLEILRKKRRNWEFSMTLHKIMPQKRKQLETWTMPENQQLTKYIDRLQSESLGIHRGAGIPDLKTKQAQTQN